MLSFERPNQESRLYEEYIDLISNQWSDQPNNDEFSGVPKPILLCLNKQLLGGVTFTLFKSPENSSNALWINTLFVKPQYRGKKFASKLLAEALSCAKQAKVDVLYVYTEAPQLYLKHGWTALSHHGQFSVLKLGRL